MLHTEVKVNSDYTFAHREYEYGIQVIPYSAIISIYDNAGTAIVSNANCDIDAEGTMRYVFLSTDNDEEAENFKAEFTFSYVSSIYYPIEHTLTYAELFDVVKYPLVNVVSDKDLFTYMPELRSNVGDRFATSSATGTTATLIDSELKTDSRDWRGGNIEIYLSDTTIHRALITSFTKSTGTITFDPAYTSSIPSGTKYFARTSYESLISEAFNTTVDDIRNKVGKASGYINSKVTRIPTIHKTLEIYCGGRIEVDGDKWQLAYERHKSDYASKLGSIQEPYDLDEDGNISEIEDNSRPSTNSAEVQI